ncbi:hypothetical protein D3C87_1612890 [compost metagenome]
MAYSTEVDQFTAPVTGHPGHGFEAREVVVGTGRDDRRERQRPFWQRIPAIGPQAFRGWISGRPAGLEVRRCGQQGALDRAVMQGGPVHHHQYAGTVSHQDHRTGNLLQLALDRFHACGQAELVRFQWRY